MFEEKKCICIEQGYMYNKTVINGSPVVAHQISGITDPREIKRLGSAITVSDREQWDAMKGTGTSQIHTHEGLRGELVVLETEHWERWEMTHSTPLAYSLHTSMF